MDEESDLTSLNWLLTSNVMPSGIATVPIEAAAGSSGLPTPITSTDESSPVLWHSLKSKPKQQQQQAGNNPPKSKNSSSNHTAKKSSPTQSPTQINTTNKKKLLVSIYLDTSYLDCE